MFLLFVFSFGLRLVVKVGFRGLFLFCGWRGSSLARNLIVVFRLFIAVFGLGSLRFVVGVVAFFGEFGLCFLLCLVGSGFRVGSFTVVLVVWWKR